MNLGENFMVASQNLKLNGLSKKCLQTEWESHNCKKCKIFTIFFKFNLMPLPSKKTGRVLSRDFLVLGRKQPEKVKFGAGKNKK